MIDWKVGDFAIARISMRAYSKVTIAKDEDGTFSGEKVLGFKQNKDGSFTAVEELCYFVKICRTGDTLWVPATQLQLAQRARPFYGRNKQAPVPTRVSKKRKIKEDITVSLNVEKVLNVVNPDKNTKYDHKHNPSIQHRIHSSFRDFVKRRLRLICMLSQDADEGRLKNVQGDLSIQDYYVQQNLKAFKGQNNLRSVCVCKDKTLHDYLYKGWRFKRELNKLIPLTFEGGEAKCSSYLNKSNTSVSENDKRNGPSLPWCLVCGKNNDLDKCTKCPASYHRYCTKQWLNTMLHRKNLSQNSFDQMYTLRKQVSSTRSIEVPQHNVPAIGSCPSCRWGPLVCYGDIVWQKMKSCPWWPARILLPGVLPSCLVTNKTQSNKWAVQYYGSKNYSWCDQNSVVLFLPQQTDALLVNESGLSQEQHEAIMEACDDYVCAYLA